jgi:hypothetical protein
MVHPGDGPGLLTVTGNYSQFRRHPRRQPAWWNYAVQRGDLRNPDLDRPERDVYRLHNCRRECHLHRFL